MKKLQIKKMAAVELRRGADQYRKDIEHFEASQWLIEDTIMRSVTIDALDHFMDENDVLDQENFIDYVKSLAIIFNDDEGCVDLITSDYISADDGIRYLNEKISDGYVMSIGRISNLQYTMNVFKRLIELSKI